MYRLGAYLLADADSGDAVQGLFGGRKMKSNVPALTLWLLVCACAATRPSQPRSQVAALAIVDVNVITMAQPDVLPHQRVLIANGLIEALGPADAVTVPAGARQIDGTGKYLVPGFIDAYSHVDGEFTLVPYLANGVTTVRNTAGGYPRHLAIRDRVSRGELLGPRVLTTGGAIGSTPPNFDATQAIDTAEETERVVAELHRFGFDGVMVYGRIGADAHRGVMSAARRLGFPVTGHQSINLKPAQVAQSGQRSVENLVSLISLQTGEGLRGEAAERAADAYRDGGVYCIPTLTVHRVRGRFQLASAEEDRYFPPLARGTPTLGARFGPQATYQYGGAPNLVSIFHSRGVKIVLGTDAGYPGVHPGFSLHGPYGELQNLHGAGLTPFEVLRAATANAAEFLGLAQRVGTIAPGKAADLVLLDGNPLEDLVNAGRIAAVAMGGRWFQSAELRTLLEAQARTYEQPADRFAGLRPLPTERSVFSGLYELRGKNELVIGEERVAVQGSEKDCRTLTSQASLDPYHSTKTELAIKLCEQARVEQIELTREAPEGKARLRMLRERGQAVISGTRPYYGNIVITEPLADTTLLGGPILSDDLPYNMMGTFFVAADALAGLQPLQKTVLTWKQLELNPGEYFRDATVSDMEWKVSRDEGTKPSDPCPACRVYSLTMSGRAGTGSHQMKLVVDPDGHPWRVETVNEGQMLAIQRVAPRSAAG